MTLEIRYIFWALGFCGDSGYFVNFKDFGDIVKIRLFGDFWDFGDIVSRLVFLSVIFLSVTISQLSP